MASPIIRYFVREQEPEPGGPVRQVESIIANHARYLDAVLPDGAEKSAGLRKLLEASECMQRAALALPDGLVLPSAVELDQASLDA